MRLWIRNGMITGFLPSKIAHIVGIAAAVPNRSVSNFDLLGDDGSISSD